MGWQDELQRRIGAMTEADWELEAALHGDCPEWTGFIVPCSSRFASRNFATIRFALGRVNDKELAGKPAGTIILLGMSADYERLNFGVRRHLPWERSAYADFDSLQETYLDLPPLL